LSLENVSEGSRSYDFLSGKNTGYSHFFSLLIVEVSKKEFGKHQYQAFTHIDDTKGMCVK